VPDREQERQLLVLYRARKRDLEGQISALSRERRGVDGIIDGLEIVLGEKNRPSSPENRAARGLSPLGPDPLLEGATPTVNNPAAYELTTLEKGLYALCHTMTPMTAMDIVRWLDAFGMEPPNYQTLYKTLRAEADKPKARITKSKEKFCWKQPTPDPQAAKA
jgi:hypothetical protein